METNALLASASGATTPASGLDWANPSLESFSPPDAMISPPRKAATTATPHRARDESEDITKKTPLFEKVLLYKTPAAPRRLRPVQCATVTSFRPRSRS